MRNGKLKECGYATPQPYAAYRPTAEAGGYLKDGRSATADSDTSHIPVEYIYKAENGRSATADSDIRHDIERTCEGDTERRKKVACCGSCRRATIFQVTPGFSRGVRMAIKHGVAEPHS